MSILIPVSFPKAEEIKKNLPYQEGLLLPAFCDPHVHFREPGQSYKETILTGSKAALHGGYSSVFTMPNLKPVPDSLEHLEEETRLIQEEAQCTVYPYGALTVGEKGKELADLKALAPHVIAFSDDGRGVQDKELMKKAMEKAKRLNKVVALHCEVDSLTNNGVIHESEFALSHKLPTIPSSSEYEEVYRDILLAKETGVKLHICHISTKESCEDIRQAKKDGIDITCETAPHYLLLDDTMLKDDGSFKMKPPLADPSDRIALLEGLKDGTIDMIATDHAPHSKEEKSKGLLSSSFGIVGLETAFPLLYTYLVKKGVISLEKLIDLMSFAPRRRFSLAYQEGDATFFDISTPYKIDPTHFFSLGRSTPFTGWEVYGQCLLTMVQGEEKWKK